MLWPPKGFWKFFLPLYSFSAAVSSHEEYVETLVGLESQSPVIRPMEDGTVGHGSDLAQGLPPPGGRLVETVSAGGPASNSVTFLSGDDEPRQYVMDSSAPLDAPLSAVSSYSRALGLPVRPLR